jgi:hypothetical protein
VCLTYGDHLASQSEIVGVPPPTSDANPGVARCRQTKVYRTPTDVLVELASFRVCCKGLGACVLFRTYAWSMVPGPGVTGPRLATRNPGRVRRVQF